MLVGAAVALASGGCDLQQEQKQGAAVSPAAPPTGMKVTFRAKTMTFGGGVSNGLANGLGWRFGELKIGDMTTNGAGTNYLFDCGLGSGSPLCTSADAPRTWNYPDDNNVCTPNCVGLNSRDPKANWFRTGFVPVSSDPVPIAITMQLIDFGQKIFPNTSVPFKINVDPTSGTATAGPKPWHGDVTDLTGDCVTVRLVPGQWKLCWEVKVESCAAGECNCSTEICDGEDNDCDGDVDESPPGCIRPWDLVANLAPGQTSTTDSNGLLLNPRWGWQVGDRGPPAPDETQSSQFHTHQSAFLCTQFGPGPGHTNWMDATYVGFVRWDSHSPNFPNGDDDYNISILPLDVVDTPFPAGIMAGNDSWERIIGLPKPKVIQCEFDSEETVDKFSDTFVPWWTDFHNDVDAGQGPACRKVTNHRAIVTGRMGWDTGHAGTANSKSELHPAHIIAIRQDLNVNARDDAWGIFFRNWGNQGYCGDGSENIDLTTMSVELERPTPAQGVPANATCTVLSSTELFQAKVPNPGFSIECDAAHPNPLLTVRLGSPSAESLVVGSVHLAWSPTIAATEPPLESGCPSALQAELELEAGEVEDEPETEWAEAIETLSPAQQEFATAFAAGMVPPEAVTLARVPQVPPIVPPPRTGPPPESQFPPSQRALLKARARIMAVCAAAHGNLPGWPGLCESTAAGARECIYASDSVAIGPGAALSHADGSPGAISNSGSGFTAVGPRAQVGAINSVGSVLVGPAATVGGAISTGGRVRSLAGANITGPILENQTLVLPGVGLDVTFPPEKPRRRHWFHRFPTHFGDHRPIRVAHHKPVSLEPGAYGAIVVEPGGVLSLSAGTYYFDDVTIEPRGTILVESSAGAVAIYVRNNLVSKGLFSERGGGAPNLLIGAIGRFESVVEAPFTGTIIVPNGTLSLPSSGAPGYAGAFLAKRVTIGPGATVSCSAF